MKPEAQTQTQQSDNQTRQSKRELVKVILMAIAVVILLPILAVNLTLIIKGSLNADTPPDLFGIAPLAVTSGSMAGENPDSFDEGALIFVKLLDEAGVQELKEGDVITFRSEESYVTHRIIQVMRDESGAAVSFLTQGDANSVNDGAIPAKNVVGLCVGSMAGLGSFAVFMQTPAGILVFVGVPVVLFIIYDVTRIALYNRRIRAEKSQELDEKDEEIRRLRALVEGAPSAGDAPDSMIPPSEGAETAASETSASDTPASDGKADA